MELKRPFTDEEFQATPEPVRQYIVQLEDIVIKLYKKTEDLKKRVTELENRLNKNSQNSSNPPSSDTPYKKPPKQTWKNRRKRGGQKGHKGHRQKLMKPTSATNIIPKIFTFGGSVAPRSILRSLIRQIDHYGYFLTLFKLSPPTISLNECCAMGFMAKRSKGTQSQKGNLWVERIFSLICNSGLFED